MTNMISFAISPKQDEDKLKYINLIPVDENTVVLMIVSESGKVSNTALKMKAPYNEERLAFLAKVMTFSYRGKTISNIMTMDIIKDFESDIEALSKLAESIMPKFMNTLEGMLDVELYLDGLTNIFAIPEYNDIERAKMVLKMFNQKQDFTNLLINRDSGMIITIGEENTDETLQNCSLITATYRINGKLVGKLGVVGPTRMKYDEITSVIEYMTDNLSTAFKITGGEENE